MARYDTPQGKEVENARSHDVAYFKTGDDASLGESHLKERRHFLEHPMYSGSSNTSEQSERRISDEAISELAIKVGNLKAAEDAIIKSAAQFSIDSDLDPLQFGELVGNIGKELDLPAGEVYRLLVTSRMSIAIRVAHQRELWHHKEMGDKNQLEESGKAGQAGAQRAFRSAVTLKAETMRKLTLSEIEELRQDIEAHRPANAVESRNKELAGELTDWVKNVNELLTYNDIRLELNDGKLAKLGYQDEGGIMFYLAGGGARGKFGSTQIKLVRAFRNKKIADISLPEPDPQ